MRRRGVAQVSLFYRKPGGGERAVGRPSLVRKCLKCNKIVMVRKLRPAGRIAVVLWLPGDVADGLLVELHTIGDLRTLGRREGVQDAENFFSLDDGIGRGLHRHRRSRNPPLPDPSEASRARYRQSERRRLIRLAERPRPV